MTHAAILETLGAPKALASMLVGATPNQVACWRVRGRIPPRFWGQVAALPQMRAAGVTVAGLQAALFEHEAA